MSELASESSELRILCSLRRIAHSLEKYSKNLDSDHNITAPQLLCLLALRGRGGATPSQVADEVYLSRSTVAGVINRLEEKELLERQQDSRDRRRFLLTLTDQGREVAAELPLPLSENALDEGQRQSVLRSLKTLAECLSITDEG